MVEVPILQEQLSTDRHGWRKCQSCIVAWAGLAIQATYYACRTQVVEASQEQRPRAVQEQLPRSIYWPFVLNIAALVHTPMGTEVHAPALRSRRHTTAMDGGSVYNAGAIIDRPPWMAEMPIMQEHLLAVRPEHRRSCASMCLRYAVGGIPFVLNIKKPVRVIPSTGSN